MSLPGCRTAFECASVGLLTVALLATPAPARAGSQEREAFPEVHMSMGYARGNWCNPRGCSFDPTGFVFSGGLSSSDSIGWYAGLVQVFSMRDVCVGVACGDPPGGFVALTGGIAYRVGRMRGHLAIGPGLTHGASHLVADAAVGFELLQTRAGAPFVQLQATSSSSSPRNLGLAGVSVGWSFRRTAP